MSELAKPDPPQFLFANAELDPDDRALVRLLQLDGRASFSHLARELRLGEKNVRTRYKRLTESRIVQISVVTDPRSFGYDSSALLGIEVDGTVGVTDLVNALMELAAVDYVVTAAGRFSMFVEVFCPTRRDLLELAASLIPEMPGISRVEAFPYLFVHYQQGRPFAQRANDPDTGVRSAALDTTDRQILRALAADARAPVQTIAHNLGINEARVRYRIRRMESANVMQVVGLVNPLGTEGYCMAWLAIRARADARVGDLANDLTRASNVSYVVVCGGRFDIFVEIAAETPERLSRLIDDEVRSVDGIHSLEISLYLDLHYRPLMPVTL